MALLEADSEQFIFGGLYFQAVDDFYNFAAA